MAQTRTPLHDISHLARLGCQARQAAQPFGSDQVVETITFSVDDASVLVMTTNATDELGCELVAFCPPSRADTARAALRKFVVEMLAGAAGFSQPVRLGKKQYAALPVVLPPPMVSTEMVTMLADVAGGRPAVIAELIPLPSDTVDDSTVNRLALSKHAPVGLIPATTISDLVEFRDRMSVQIEGLLDALGLGDEPGFGGSGTEGEVLHPVASGVAPDLFEEMDLSGDMLARVPPHIVPEFGGLTTRAYSALIGDHPAFNVEPEEIELMRFTFSLEGTVVAMAQVTCFLPSIDLLDAFSHHVDGDWLSTFVDENFQPRACVREAGWDDDLFVARMDGLWIAPAFRDVPMLRAVIARVQGVLASMIEGAEFTITLGTSSLADGYQLADMSEREAEWYAHAYRHELGAVRSGPVVHGCFTGGPMSECPNHAPWYILPPA